MIGEYELDGMCCSKKEKRPQLETKDANENLVSAAPPPRPASPPNLYSLDPYSLDYPRMGRCIVVTPKPTAPSPNAGGTHGTDEDVRSLAWSFTRLHFHVDVVQSESVAELRALVRELSEFDHTRYASFVLCLLTRGELGLSQGRDSEPLLRELLEAFSPKRCPSLKGKPKLFLVQGCRFDPDAASDGAIRNGKRNGHVQPKRPAADFSLPLHEDFVLACSYGYVELPEASFGTPFIQKFCRVLDSSDVTSSHILDILTKVCRAITLEATGSSRLQTATVSSNLSKLFYLKPKAT